MAGDSALVSLQGREGRWTRAAESCWLAEAPGVPLGRPEACLPPCPPRERLSALSPCGAPCALWRPGPPLTRPAAPLAARGRLRLHEAGLQHPLPCFSGHSRAAVICTKAIKAHQALPGAGNCILVPPPSTGQSSAARWEGVARDGGCAVGSVLTCEATPARQPAFCQEAPSAHTSIRLFVHPSIVCPSLGPPLRVLGCSCAPRSTRQRTRKSFPVG